MRDTVQYLGLGLVAGTRRRTLMARDKNVARGTRWVGGIGYCSVVTCSTGLALESSGGGVKNDAEGFPQER